MSLPPVDERCIRCGACRKGCSFLTKYGLDSADYAELEPLAFHCFQCGDCSRACPVGIDGKGSILQMRRETVADRGLEAYDFGLILREKARYPFANYREATGKSVLFPGCNFISLYPETLRLLAEQVRDIANMGIAFDCCSKPVTDLGLDKDAERIRTAIERRLVSQGVEEVVTLCPGCYEVFSQSFTIKVTNIYDKLAELGIGRILDHPITLYPSCPDKDGLTWVASLRSHFAPQAHLLTGSMCCGEGGSAIRHEPLLATQMRAAVAERITSEKPEDNTRTLHTYCATCIGSFSKVGSGWTRHVLLDILGSDEAPKTGSSLINRVRARFWRARSRRHEG